ncbi:hypothetical protein QBC44DRAFT_394014 [Cladorrhinum sp. PSN332]|nr:hypothetical protein QBC44DRAFT_394014 [Cladorrhinum sp. PSN332]
MAKTKPPPKPGLPSFSSLLPSITIPLSSPIWTLIEKLYALPPPPPPPKRTKPMQVLCVGLPRSGTESLQKALLILGYDYTYHGSRKKFFPSPTSQHEAEDDKSLSSSTFDTILSASTAVTDAPCSLFASEMITSYPEAKIILNMRQDTQSWQKSLVNTIVKANESWPFWIASWLDQECFWAWHVYERFLWPQLFRVGPGESLRDGVEKRAGLVAREHCAMIRGMVAKERLLEWYIEDGWGPLCKFLGKPVPDVSFPHANAANGGWKAREEQCNKRWIERAFLRLITGGVVLALLISIAMLRL